MFEPTVPPASSPAVEVSGVTDGLILALVDQLEAGAVVTFHLSGDQTAAGSFVPSAATSVGPATASSIASPTTLPDGTPLTEGTTYWARAVASNAVGDAPAGPAASGSPDRSRPRSLITDTLKSLRAILDRLDIGQAYIDADEGFMIPNPPPPNGGDRTWSRIPFDGVSPMVMLIDLIATRLSVQGVAEFLDRVTFRRRAMAADGVSAPSLAPTVAPHWPAVATTAGTAGLALDPSNAARWVTAYVVPFTSQTPQRVGLRSVMKTTGAQATFHTGATTQATAVAGLTVIGQRIYVLSQLTGFTSQWKVSVFDTVGAQAPWTWIRLDEVDQVEVISSQVASARPRRLADTPRYASDVVLRSRRGLFTRVRVPGTDDQSLTDEERDRLVESWLSAHLGSILTVEPRDVPGKCGERDCLEPHP
ncbi:hypothetical protein [uncultured Nocardioides sp.]|uniref:hypothetical protein n=1 Tax=uncultured Nocardioides sp. TaxID=198441 RepID=UPI0026067D3E|nr:hypothetical protein [uncultured Nocardioides sp.]